MPARSPRRWRLMRVDELRPPRFSAPQRAGRGKSASHARRNLSCLAVLFPRPADRALTSP